MSKKIKLPAIVERRTWRQSDEDEYHYTVVEYRVLGIPVYRCRKWDSWRELKGWV